MPDCPTGKLAHASETAARRFAAGLGFVSCRQRAYRCKACGGWHLTTGEAVPKAWRPKPGTRKRRGVPVPQPATRAELDAWFAEHGQQGHDLP